VTCMQSIGIARGLGPGDGREMANPRRNVRGDAARRSAFVSSSKASAPYPVGPQVEAVDARLALLAAIRRPLSKRWSVPPGAGTHGQVGRGNVHQHCVNAPLRPWSVKTSGETLALVAGFGSVFDAEQALAHQREVRHLEEQPPGQGAGVTPRGARPYPRDQPGCCGRASDPATTPRSSTGWCLPTVSTGAGRTP
jgi:hypothetical protein